MNDEDKTEMELLKELRDKGKLPPLQNNRICPHCGRCPVCGERLSKPYYWVYPDWSTYPRWHITWTSNTGATGTPTRL